MNNDDLMLSQYWQEMVKEKFDLQKIKKQEVMNAIQKDSQLTIASLQKRLMHKLMWIVFFVLCFSIGMLFSLHNTELLIVLGVFNAIYMITFVLVLVQYRKMKKNTITESTLEMLRNNYRSLKRALNIERIFGITTFPIAIIGGVLIRRLIDGYTLQECLNNQRLLWMVLGAIIILVPLMYLLSEKLNKIAFGELRQKLEKSIARLEILE